MTTQDTSTRRRVKLYALNADRQWDDRGTGHVTSSYVERLKGISLLVRAENDGSLLLESKIQPDTAYQKQQDTLIVWSEGDNFDLALSFQEKAGCDEIWERICIVQGKDPSVDTTQDLVEESEDERFEEMSDSAPPIELPVCELARLEEISELIAQCLNTQMRKEKLALALEQDSYIKKLLLLFHICEHLENNDGLHYLFEIFKNIFLLNRTQLFEIMFAEDTIFDVVGCLEYDPSGGPPKRHRHYLKQYSKFREPIEVKNPDLLAKIHQTYRVQYIQDIVLPAPSVFEDAMLNSLSSFIFFNKCEIVTLIQDDDKFLDDLFALLSDRNTPLDKRRDSVLFLKEFCSYAQLLQPHAKDAFYKSLISLGILPALEIILNINEPKIKSASIDILTTIVEYSPSLIRDYTLTQYTNQEHDDDVTLINIAIEQMLNDSEPELGGAVQLMGVIRILLDPENMMASANKGEKTDFLNFFYKNSIQILIAPLMVNTVSDKPASENYHTVQLLALVLELLSFCVEHHSYHIKNCILNKDLLRRILILMKSTHTFLVLGALRFLRKIASLKDEFYNRYIIKGNLFAPVAEAFIRNNGRYNLLESAILELFEFIKLEDIKSLCTYVVENFGKIFDEIQYVQTFKNLRNKYDQQQDRLKDKEKSGYDTMPSILRRYRRDQRQMDVDEELWFNEEDDFDDVSTGKITTPDLDNSLGKILDKKAAEIVAAAAAANNGPKQSSPTASTTTTTTTITQHQQNLQSSSSPPQSGTNNPNTTTTTTTNVNSPSSNIRNSSISSRKQSSSTVTHAEEDEDDDEETGDENETAAVESTSNNILNNTNTATTTVSSATATITSSDSTLVSKDNNSAAATTTTAATTTAATADDEDEEEEEQDDDESKININSTSSQLTSQTQSAQLKPAATETPSMSADDKEEVSPTSVAVATADDSKSLVKEDELVIGKTSDELSLKKGLVDYEADSDEEENDDDSPVTKKARLA